LVDTLGRLTGFSDAVGLLVGNDSARSASIALFILLSVNGVGSFRFFIALVNSLTVMVILLVAAVDGSSNLVGRKTYVSESLIPLVDGI